MNTVAASNITTTSAIVSVAITSDGGSTITAKGVRWSKTSGPTINNSETNFGSDLGDFAVSINGLTSNTDYYVSAYATNSQGAAYGNEVSFITNIAITLPTLTTTTPANVASFSATWGGNIISDGNATVTERGICYSTSTNPTTSNTKVIIGSGIGTFSNSITGLTANTNYYVRAYAINSQSKAYGNEVSFNPTCRLSYKIAEKSFKNAVFSG